MKNKKELKDYSFPGFAVIDKYEKSLQESEEKYRLLIEAASDAIVVMDEKGNFIQTNSKGYEMLGYSEKELMTMNIVDVIPKEDLKKDPLQLFKLKPGETLFKERNLKCKSGKKIIVEASIVRHSNNTLQVILRDVTERRNAEKAMAQAQENYKNLIEYSPDGIFIHDEKGEVFFANPAALKIMGVNHLDELESKHIFHYLLPEYKKSVKEQRKKMDKGEPLEFIMLKIRRIDGKVIEVESKPIEITYEGKQAILIVYHDISNQRQLEREQMRAQIAEETNILLQKEIKERIKAEKKIDESKKYITSVIESSLDIICAADKEGNITEFNMAAQKMFGFKRNEIIGKSVDILYKYNVDRIKVSTGLQVKGEFNGEITNIRKNGTEFLSHISASVLKDENGGTIGFMGVSRDITDKKEIEEKIKRSLKEKEVLLKEVHHRVKNNLQVISSILNLQSSYVTDQKTLDLLRESQDRIKSMSFIHEILYQNKDFSNINFSEYVRNLTNNLIHSYSKNNNVSFKLSVGEIFLNLDLAIPCGLAINELISNALKYAFVEKEKGEIAVTISEADEFIKLNVSDNGKGFPKKINYRNTDSLGLQLVMTLVEQLEGDIMLDSSKGTSFTIIFKNTNKK